MMPDAFFNRVVEFMTGPIIVGVCSFFIGWFIVYGYKQRKIRKDIEDLIKSCEKKMPKRFEMRISASDTIPECLRKSWLEHSLAITGRVNSEMFFGYPAGKLLCVGGTTSETELELEFMIGKNEWPEPFYEQRNFKSTITYLMSAYNAET